MFTLTASRFRLLVTAGAVMLAFAVGAPRAVADPPGQTRVHEQLGEIGAWAVPATSKEKPLVSESQQTSVREKLGEIGAWAVPSTSQENSMVRESQQTSVREKLGEIGAWAIPSTSKKGPLLSEKLDGLNLSAPTTSLAPGSEGFEWGDAAIGAGAAAALCAAAAAAVAVRKRVSPAQ